MATENVDIIVNSDGTITRRGTSSSGYGGSSYSGGSSNNTGGVLAVIIIVCIIIGIIIVVNRDDGNDVYQEPIETVYDFDDYIVDEEEITNQATYLRVSQSNVTFDANGGSVNIDINTDGDWEIGTPPESWVDVSKYSSSLTLSVDQHIENKDRTDWFTITAGNLQTRIDIFQKANTEPSANIERVWMDHNVYYNGYQGMMIHVSLSVENLKGQTVNVYACFYQADNTTPLHDYYYNNLYFYETGNVNHDSGQFDDFRIFVPYTGLNMAPGTSGTFSFDIVVKHSGKQLDRNNDNRFTFSNI